MQRRKFSREFKLEAVRLVKDRGVAVAQAARDLDLHENVLRKWVRELSGDPQHALPPSLSRLLSVPLLETVSNECPNIRIRIAEALSADIIDWIATDRLDIGYVYEVPHVAQFHVAPVLLEQTFLIAAREDWDGEFNELGRAEAPVSLEGLSKLPLVMTSKNTKLMQKRLVQSHRLKLNVVAELDSLPHILEMVDRGSAYTLMPHGAVFEQVANGQFGMIPIEGELLDRTAYLVMAKSKKGNRVNNVITNYVAESKRFLDHTFQPLS